MASGDTVTVRYTKPRGCGGHCSWGLRGASHIAVDSFPHQGPPVTIWSATLTVAELVAGGTTYRGCFANNPGKECGDALTTSSFMSGGTDYRVRSLTRTGDSFEFILDDTAIPQGWTLHIGDHEFSVADATVSGGDNDIAIWTNPGFSWTANQMVSLRLTRPSGASSQAVTNNSAAPVFSSATFAAKTLTLTFDKNLDAGSKSLDPRGLPRHRERQAFSPHRLRRPRHFAGKTVKLTLFRPASDDDTVKVRYTRPSANPLRGANGLAVDTFADQAVSHDPPGTIWSATLTVTVGRIASTLSGCDDAGAATLACCYQCGSAIQSFHGQWSERVIRSTRGHTCTSDNLSVMLQSAVSSSTRHGPIVRGALGCCMSIIFSSRVADADFFRRWHKL